jgi:parallel beta-helix repeat protein
MVQKNDLAPVKAIDIPVSPVNRTQLASSPSRQFNFGRVAKLLRSHLKFNLALVVLVFLCLGFSYFTPANTAQAATGINHQINFQGKLVNTNGTNVTDGTYTVIFSIYTVASAGANIWTETQSVTTTSGIFQVNLGSVTTLPGSIDFNTDNIYLGIKVGADAEMTPRVQFTAVPQAFNSEKLGGLDKTGFIQNTTVQQATSNFNISGAGVVGTNLTAGTSLIAPLLQSAAATALTITGNAASTWSTSAGNITLQAGSGTISLGSTTTLSSTGALTITGGTTLALTSTGTNAISLDSGTTGAINIGTNANAKTITVGNVTGATGVVVDCGTNGCSFGASATAHLTTLGSVNSTSTSTLQAGTGGVNIGTGGIANTIQIGSTTGAVAQTINIGTNGTASSSNNVLIGSIIAGSTTIQNNTSISLNAATIVGNATVQNLINTVATTVNFAGAATTLSVGAAGGTSTFNGNLAVAAGKTFAVGTGASTLGGTLGVTGTITGSSTVQGTQLISTIATGTSPLTVASTTLVTNLNADMVDGFHAASFALASGSGGYIQNGTGVQASGNFYIRSAAIGSVGGIIEGASGQTADLLRLNTWNGTTSTTVASFSAAGALTLPTNGLNVGAGQLQVTSGNVTASGTITGTTNNGTVGINTGAGAGTIRIDSSGNLSNIGTIAASGSLTVGGVTSISSSGLLQNAAIDPTLTYSNLQKVGALSAGSLAAGFTTVAATVGGTGQSSYVIGDLLFASSTTALSRLADVGTGQCVVSGGIGAAISWGICGAGSANTALSNLAAVAINTSLLPGVTNSIDLGSGALTVRTGYFGTSVITPVVDTASAVALNVGTTASVINLNKNVVVAAGQSLTLTGSGSRPGSPTDGMLYYDTTQHQLLQYSSSLTKWVGDRNSSTKIVAASNSSQAEKDSADYVATGAGDQAQINSALTAAAGGTVYLMEGTYSTTASINVPNNTVLSGAGTGTIIIPGNLANTITNTDTVNGTNVTIQNLSINGNNNFSFGTQYGIYFNGMGSLSRPGGSILNVKITQFNTGAGISLNASSHNTITADTVIGIYCGCGFYYNNGILLTTSSNNLISNNFIQANSVAGISITTSSTHNTVTGNNVYDNGDTTTTNNNGIYISASSSNAITNNEITDSACGNTCYAINIFDSTSVSNVNLSF